MNARLKVKLLRVTSPRKVPPTPTNAERLREYRQRAEAVIGNLHPWRWCAK